MKLRKMIWGLFYSIDLPSTAKVIDYNKGYRLLRWEDPMAKKKATNDISQILIFPFQDQQWVKKIAIASVLVFISFIPILPIVLLLGYMAEIIRRIAVNKESPSLPEWDDLGIFFQDGFRLFGAGLIYMIPPALLMIAGYAGMFIPLIIMETGVVGQGQGLLMMIAGYVAGFGLMGIGALISMVTGIVLPVAGAHAAVKRDFSAALKFGEIGNILKANWSGFLVAFLILIGGSVVLYYGSYFLIATVILCCLYPFVICVVVAYLAVVGAALFGEAYRDGLMNLPAEK